MKHPNTTVLGILTIASAIIGAAIEFLKTGTCNMVTLGTGITAGWGLISAADSTAH